MSTQSSDALRSDLAHLYRRAGFGATPAELDAAVSAGYAATVAALVAPSAASDPGVTATPAPVFDVLTPPGKSATATARQQYNAKTRSDSLDLTMWWIDRMVMATNPFPEKLTFFWHGHFATAIQKVRSAALMLRQNDLFRSQGLGAFDALDLAVARDPAMMIWLDTAQDVAADPNENFARENMELFTLGYGNYTEDDVREAARCYTGWRYNKTTDAFTEIARLHDNGSKTVLGQTGDFDGSDVVRILTHSTASYRWVCTRVWCRFAKTITTDPVVNTLMTTYAPQLDVSQLMTAAFTAPEFLATKGELVKQPVEYVVGALRALKLRASSQKYLAVLKNLGQVPFDPPNVGGWPFDDAWLTTAASYTRLQFAHAIAGIGDISAVADESASGRADAAAHLLSVDSWGPQTRVALAQIADDPVSLVTLALCAPEYVVN
ncbi:MAG TPA: DUF1800 domain-containing protein [Acidothermaceae bacterium]|jgi:uncharacterized protein (DUF1800 family)|nr:DUF1800 domain-containing protein [Acidothermaceae bacterium]